MLQKSTIQFLKQLEKNNNREWFNKNKHLYEAARADYDGFVDALIQAISKFDSSVKGLKAKDCTFRIYRDVRFSKNKAPYKDHFGAYLAEGGRKSMKPGYYIHLQPGKSFLAGGAYQPESAVLNAIRQEIDYNLKEFQGILKSKAFSRYFKKLEGETVKTTPKGYDKDHVAIAYLKHKDFLAMHALKDDQIMAKNAVSYVTKGFQVMKPFNDFLARAYE